MKSPAARVCKAVLTETNFSASKAHEKKLSILLRNEGRAALPEFTAQSGQQFLNYYGFPPVQTTIQWIGWCGSALPAGQQQQFADGFTGW